jgi:hypothetical protein
MGITFFDWENFASLIKKYSWKDIILLFNHIMDIVPMCLPIMTLNISSKAHLN